MTTSHGSSAHTIVMDARGGLVAGCSRMVRDDVEFDGDEFGGFVDGLYDTSHEIAGSGLNPMYGFTVVHTTLGSSSPWGSGVVEYGEPVWMTGGGVDTPGEEGRDDWEKVGEGVEGEGEKTWSLSAKRT